jgi:transposase
VRKASVWARLLGVERTVFEQIEFDDEEDLVICHVRPVKAGRQRCGICRRRCGGYDAGAGRRRWRTLDLGTIRAVLEADAPRVRCPDHGVVVAAVPWARHAAGHTRFFDDQVAWLAVTCSKTAVCQLMRIAWRSVGAIVARVCADVDAVTDRFAGLRRIGIDEISCKKGHKYLTIFTCRLTSRATPGSVHGPGEPLSRIPVPGQF